MDVALSSAGSVIAVFALSCSLMLAAEPQTAEKKQLKLSPNSTNTALVQAQPKASPTIAVYKSVKSDGTAMFSDRQPLNRPFQLVRYDCFACDPGSKVNWHTVPLYILPFNQFIAKAADEHQLDPALIRAVIHAESSFRPSAISRKGAVGLMQLMPDTARQLGISDASAPEQNIAAGSRYLAQLLKQHNGELPLALAAYNAGSSNVRRYNGIPPFAETQAYVERVAILHKRYQRAG
ncbi:soluble lytic murein transglycosylase-like protein [Rheinheimera pacifica]|uniref:lytic transglycosylase domain-containing protein n=1 Tax=Rheinheimera pacifica TaxID=173990 RepID=UPI00285F715C|nr:lytic transglycosylase domain-containing protein [Rheinheimera pacifica]MDR6982291.1 soluble lytic murein transglycosylase-like protein [Rheinheimera pacifica]